MIDGITCSKSWKVYKSKEFRTQEPVRDSQLMPFFWWIPTVDGRNIRLTTWYDKYPRIYRLSKTSQVVFSPDFFQQQDDSPSLSLKVSGPKPPCFTSSLPSARRPYMWVFSIPRYYIQDMERDKKKPEVGVMFCPQTWESKAISQVFVPWKNPSEGSFYSPPLSWKKGLVSRGLAVRNLRFPCNVLLKHKDYCWVWQKTIMAEEHGEATSFRCCVVLSQQKILQRLAFSDFSSYVFLISPYNGWRQKLQPRFPKGLNGCLLRVLCLFEVI